MSGPERPACPFAHSCEQLVTEWWFNRYCMGDFTACRYYRERMVERRRPRDWWEAREAGFPRPP